MVDFDLSAEELAPLDSPDTGVQGGPEPEDVTREAFGREIPGRPECPTARGPGVGRADRSQPAGATVRRMTVFFIPFGRTKSKPQRSYIARVPL